MPLLFHERQKPLNTTVEKPAIENKFMDRIEKAIQKNLHCSHDTFFRFAFSNMAIARDFLKRHLPTTILIHCNLETLRCENGTFANKYLKLKVTDMLYSL